MRPVERNRRERRVGVGDGRDQRRAVGFQRGLPARRWLAGRRRHPAAPSGAGPERPGGAEAGPLQEPAAVLQRAHVLPTCISSETGASVSQRRVDGRVDPIAGAQRQ